MTYVLMILFTAFFVLIFTDKSKKYQRIVGTALIVVVIITAVHSIFFDDKVKDGTPIGIINSEMSDGELGSIYSIEGVIDEMYTCTEYTNNKPQEVRILKVNDVVCKLCPCEDEYVEVGYDVELKGRLVYTGELNILKGCYVLDIK